VLTDYFWRRSCFFVSNNSLFIRQSTENTRKNSLLIISNPNGKSWFNDARLAELGSVISQPHFDATCACLMRCKFKQLASALPLKKGRLGGIGFVYLQPCLVIRFDEIPTLDAAHISSEGQPNSIRIKL